MQGAWIEPVPMACDWKMPVRWPGRTGLVVVWMERVLLRSLTQVRIVAQRPEMLQVREGQSDLPLAMEWYCSSCRRVREREREK